jgi:hypothetical protein
MPGTTPTAEEVLSTMRAIADGLAAAGMEARLHETYGCIDITAVDRQRDIEAIIDDDSYVDQQRDEPNAGLAGQDRQPHQGDGEQREKHSGHRPDRGRGQPRPVYGRWRRRCLPAH